MKRRKKKLKRKQKLKIREIGVLELKAIIERAKVGTLSEEDTEKLEVAVDTLAFLTQELEKKGVSLKRLRKLIFGASTEKTSEVFKDTPEDTGEKKAKKKRKGHGRNGASDYKGAEKIKVRHELLRSGDHCPGCRSGRTATPPTFCSCRRSSWPC